MFRSRPLAYDQPGSSRTRPCGQPSEQDLGNTIECNSFTLRLPSPSFQSDLEEDDRGRLLTRIPGTVRSPGRPRTLRHTGPSIHIWLEKHHGSPVRSEHPYSGFEASNVVMGSGWEMHTKDRDVSPFSGSSLDGSDLLPANPVGCAANNEHLLPSDKGVTVTRILRSPQDDSPDSFIQNHDPARFNKINADLELKPHLGISRRPSPVSAGMRYTALWEWICSDAVPTTRLQSFVPSFLNPPGRFVEYERFAYRHAVHASISGGSNTATGLRAQS
jgi:hypothetical protein